MGWLYMRSLKNHSTPQGYLDDQFTHDESGRTSKVLRSTIVADKVYYAAVELHRTETGEREIWALVCLIEYNPRAADGYIFGYKDMYESMGPYESNCPTNILDLLTPTENPQAQAWRARCRENAVRRTAVIQPG